MALLVLGAVLATQAWLVKPFTIPTGSMEPTIEVGQRVLVDRIGMSFTGLHLGDIVVFYPPKDIQRCANPREGVPTTGRPFTRACDRAAAQHGTQPFIKRIVGLPGDRLRIIDGHVYRNGKRELDPYISPCAPSVAVCTFPGTIVVPRGDYYMMGDNRPMSDDSRYWGPVPRAWVVGVAMLSYWPLDRIGTL